MALVLHFPQLPDVEFVWMRPRLGNNGQYLTNHGEIHRGSVFEFLNSPIEVGTPDSRQVYAFLSSGMSTNNVDGLKRRLASAHN